MSSGSATSLKWSAHSSVQPNASRSPVSITWHATTGVMRFLVGWGLMSATSEPLVAQEVTVKLGGVPIITEASFSLAEGDLALLTGPNGAGKSTLLRALVNLLPSNGDIFIAGLRPTSPEARSSFVYVPDEAALYEDLTLQEHMRFVSLIYGQEAAEERMREWLFRFGLEA